MNTFASVVGYFVIYAIIVIFLLTRINFHRNSECLLFTFFKFGFICVANGSKLHTHLKKISNHRGYAFKNRTIFLNAPEWFNKHVYNFGSK